MNIKGAAIAVAVLAVVSKSTFASDIAPASALVFPDSLTNHAQNASDAWGTHLDAIGISALFIGAGLGALSIYGIFEGNGDSKGFGVIGLIFIASPIGVGGYAALRSNQDSALELQELRALPESTEEERADKVSKMETYLSNTSHSSKLARYFESGFLVAGALLYDNAASQLHGTTAIPYVTTIAFSLAALRALIPTRPEREYQSWLEEKSASGGKVKTTEFEMRPVIGMARGSSVVGGIALSIP